MPKGARERGLYHPHEGVQCGEWIRCHLGGVRVTARLGVRGLEGTPFYHNYGDFPWCSREMFKGDPRYFSVSPLNTKEKKHHNCAPNYHHSKLDIDKTEQS